MKPILVKIELTPAQVVEYLREGLRRQGLNPPDDDADFHFQNNVNPDEVMVEVVKVSVARQNDHLPHHHQNIRTAEGESPKPAPRALRNRGFQDAEEDPEVGGDIADEVLSFNDRMPAAPVKGSRGGGGRVRVAPTLEELGKDPKDMSDEIG